MKDEHQRTVTSVSTPEAPSARDVAGQTPRPTFAHPSEEEFTRILDFYGIRWEYEPRSFPLEREGDRILEMLTPDFYLPDLDLYVELTTLKQSLVTEKNRKIRRLRELYPDIKIKLLYKKDYNRLLAKFGFGPLGEVEVKEIDRMLLSAAQIQTRVAELGQQVSKDYAGKQPVLVGVLKGVTCFMADLMRQITVPLTLEFMSISYYGTGGTSGVRITKDLDRSVTGEHVLVVEDIVDTGMTLRYLLSHIEAHEPASLRVCALLNKQARRLVDVRLDYVGFEIPDEFVVGYGLDHRGLFRNLPYIGILRPEEKPQAPEVISSGNIPKQK